MRALCKVMKRGPREAVTRVEAFKAAESLEAQGRSIFPTLLRLLACTGLRLGEALALTLSDVDFQRRTIRVRSNATGARPRLVIPPDLTIHDLVVHQTVLEARTGAKLAPLDRLFPIRATTATTALRKALLAAGVPLERASIHGLRRGAILHAVACGVPLSAVDEMFWRAG
jgi:integrase